MAANLEFCHAWIHPICTERNFTHSFWLNLMMAAILNSAMLNSHSILDSDHLSYLILRLTQKHSHSTLNWLKLIQNLDSLIYSHSTWWSGSHLEFCHIEFRYIILDSATFVIKTLTQTNSIWLKLRIKLIQSDSTHLDSHLTWWWQPSLNSAILNSGHPGFNHLSIYSQYSLTLAKIGSHHLHKKNLTHSFWLNLMITNILNSAMLNSDTCHLGFRHLVIFSQIHSKTLSLHSDSDSN